MKDYDALIEEQKAIIEAAKARIVELDAERRTIIPEFERVEDIKWERFPHTADSYALQQRLGSKYDLRPFKPAKVGDKLYRRFNAFNMRDWYAIAHHRVWDVTTIVDGAHAAELQEGDDSYESDWEDMARLVREYQGGLRYPLDTWDDFDLGKKLKVEYLKTHDDPGLEYHKRQIPLTPVG